MPKLSVEEMLAREARDMDFLEFSYDLYKAEIEDADRMYARAGFLVTALLILGGIILKLAKPELLLVWPCISVALLHLVTATATVFLVLALFHTLYTAYPRRYTRVASADQWREWREEMALYILREDMPVPGSVGGQKEAATLGPDSSVRGRTIAARAMDAFVEKVPNSLAAAQQRNVEINESRREHFQRAMFWLVRTAATVLVQSFLALAVHLGELTS